MFWLQIKNAKYEMSSDTNEGEKKFVWSTHFSKDERSVEFQVDLSVADGRDGGGTAAVWTLAELLRGRVHHLPPTVTCREIRTGHPGLVPHVEIPTEKQSQYERVYC